MKLYTYLNYGGDCEAAVRVLEEQPGGRITMVTKHGQHPSSATVPAEWKDKVLHARIELGDTILMGADIPPDRFQPMRSAYLTLVVDTEADAERLFALLIDGGAIFLKMETPFAPGRSAMSGYRSGTSWMLLQEPVGT